MLWTPTTPLDLISSPKEAMTAFMFPIMVVEARMVDVDQSSAYLRLLKAKYRFFLIVVFAAVAIYSKHWHWALMQCVSDDLIFGV